MLIAKILDGKKTKFFEVVKVGRVKFDPRPGWVFTREIDKITRRCDVAWFHPDDTPFVWVRDFRG